MFKGDASMPCREFSKATKRVIREASHADRSGNASFLGALRHCCLGVCSAAKDGRSGTKDHVSLYLELANIERRSYRKRPFSIPANTRHSLPSGEEGREESQDRSR